MAKLKYKELIGKKYNKFEEKVSDILKVEKMKGKSTKATEAFASDGTIGSANKAFNEAMETLWNDIDGLKTREIEVKNPLRLDQGNGNSVEIDDFQLVDPQLYKKVTDEAKNLKAAIEGFKSESKNQTDLVHSLYNDFIKDTVDNLDKWISGKLSLPTSRSTLSRCGSTFASNLKEWTNGLYSWNTRYHLVLDKGNWTDYKAYRYVSNINDDVFLLDKNNLVQALLEVEFLKNIPNGDKVVRVKKMTPVPKKFKITREGDLFAI